MTNTNSTNALIEARTAELAAIEHKSPTHNLSAYLAAIRQIELLSPEEEKELARRYREQGDIKAAELLVMSNLRFVVHLAKGYDGYGLAIHDLIQEGNLGLMKAVETYDPQKGVRLLSWAVHWIKSAIHKHIISNWSIVRVATTKPQRKLFFNLRRMTKNAGSILTDEEAEAIASELDVPKSDVVEMQKRLTHHALNYDESESETDRTNGEKTTFGIAVASDEASPEEQVEEELTKKAQAEALKYALATLDDRVRDIVTSRWLGEKRTTLQELADKYGISVERVRQIESAGISKLKVAMQEFFADKLKQAQLESKK